MLPPPLSSFFACLQLLRIFLLSFVYAYSYLKCLVSICSSFNARVDWTPSWVTFKSCTGDRDTKVMNNNHNPHHFLSFFVGLTIWGQKSKKSMPLGRTPGRMADGDEIVGIQVNIAWFCSQSLVMFVSGKVNVRDFRQSRDSLPKGGFREGISNTLTTRFPPLLPGCQGASALPQDDLLKPW